MNKTVNINLAGIFFHIDEDAYLKLHRYLEAIKRSFTDTQGQSEILADIEARIAELFYERIQNDRQVIGLKEVDAIIAIMGQPEDYLMDDEFFEDGPNRSTDRKNASSKKLFRDTDSSYIGGVAAGLGHYIGIEAIWVRLIWTLLALGSAGTFVFIYILFWILVPEAVTTADKLTMTGEPVNISNIEKKIKDGLDSVSQNVSDAVKNMDLQKQGNRIKSGSKTFFEALGEIILFFLKLIGKAIGILFILIGATTIIMLIVSLFSVGIADLIHLPRIDFIEATNTTSIPIWLLSFMVLLAVGIPFFFLFYLGLKILINNLKSIGQIAKFSLLGVWLITVIGLVIIGVKQASEYSEDGTIQQTETLNVTARDTLYLNMAFNNSYSKQFGRHSNSWKPVYDHKDAKLLYMTAVGLNLRSTKDSLASIRIEKSARSNTYQNAKRKADNIRYNYVIFNNTLTLDGYLTTAFENKYRDQEVVITLYIPENTVLFADRSTYSSYGNQSKRSSYINHRNFENASRLKTNTIFSNGLEGHYLQLKNNTITCLDCPNEEEISDNASEVPLESTKTKSPNDRIEVNIDQEGIKIIDDHLN